MYTVPRTDETLTRMTFVDLKFIELRDEVPQAVLLHPGMISAQERNLLYTLTANHYSGNGCIVDAGTFLGASTMAFACGLKECYGADSNQSPPPIASFERAIVSPNYEAYIKKVGLPVLPVGNSFERVLRQLIEPVRNQINLHVGDILDFDGNTLGDVEICFLDILKNKKLTLHSMRIFFPRLLPGAYVTQQDYFFDNLPFIKYSMEALSDHFEYVGECQSSAVFRLRAAIDLHDLPRDLEELDDEAKLRLHREAELRTKDPYRQHLMELSRVRLLTEIGDFLSSAFVWGYTDEKYRNFIRTNDGEYKPNIAWRIASLNDYLDRRRRGAHRRGDESSMRYRRLVTGRS